PVFGLSEADFETVEENGLSGSGVKTLEAENPQTYTLTLFTGEPEGRLGLRLKAGASARDEAGNVLSGLPYFDPDKTYWIDKTAPRVVSLRRLDESPTSASAVRFEATFSEAVQNVTPDDFSVVESGDLSGSAVTGVRGSMNVYEVSLSTGNGSGKLGLQIPKNAAIRDAAGNPLENLPFYDAETTYTIQAWIFLYLPLIQK
ncbi:MAG: Ig-like domain-containing protein, partial [Bellilinea sp.]